MSSLHHSPDRIAYRTVKRHHGSEAETRRVSAGTGDRSSTRPTRSASSASPQAAQAAQGRFRTLHRAAYRADDQPKSEKKKKYLAKKAKRHKILTKAKKAAAPKNKVWTPGSQDGSSDEDSDGEEDNGNAQAGPSKLPEPVPAPKVDLSLATANGEDDEALEEAAERERRRLQKKEKRAMRDHEEKRRRKEEKRRLREAEERAKEKGKARAEAGQEDGEEHDRSRDEDVEMAEPAGEGNTENGDGLPTLEHPETIDRPSSPPLLEAFPLPTSAPAPDPSLLSRQGLPAGLEHAQLVDQDLRIPIDDVEFTINRQRQKGVGERMARRLKEAGVTEFFAGTLWCHSSL